MSLFLLFDLVQIEEEEDVEERRGLGYRGVREGEEATRRLVRRQRETGRPKETDQEEEDCKGREKTCEVTVWRFLTTVPRE